MQSGKWGTLCNVNGEDYHMQIPLISAQFAFSLYGDNMWACSDAH